MRVLWQCKVVLKLRSALLLSYKYLHILSWNMAFFKMPIKRILLSMEQAACVSGFANTSQFLLRTSLAISETLGRGECVCVLFWLGCVSQDQIRGQSSGFHLWGFFHTENANFFYTHYGQWRREWCRDCRLNVASPVSCPHCGNTPDCPDDESPASSSLNIVSTNRCY